MYWLYSTMAAKRGCEYSDVVSESNKGKCKSETGVHGIQCYSELVLNVHVVT